MPRLLDFYDRSNQDALGGIYTGSPQGEEIGQSFQAPVSIKLYSVKFYMQKQGSPTGVMTAILYAHTGVFGTSSLPTGAALATSDALNATTLPSGLGLVEFIFSGSSYNLVAGTNYVIVVKNTTGDASNHPRVSVDASSSTHAGNNVNNPGGVWTADNTVDTIFSVFGISGFKTGYLRPSIFSPGSAR